jgi:hypothetical protein
MLDELDGVPWESLRHAFGPATNVPARLRALGSRDSDMRKDALKELFACLVYQGTVSEATEAAVPFLFELLADETTPERSWLAFLLASMGDAKGYLSLLGGPALSERGGSLELELAREQELVERVRAALGRGMSQLLPYLGDNQSEIRAAVARALGYQAKHAAELLPALERAAQGESVPGARDAMRQSIALLRASGR